MGSEINYVLMKQSLADKSQHKTNSETSKSTLVVKLKPHILVGCFPFLTKKVT